MAKVVRKKRIAEEDLPSDWEEFCTRLLIAGLCFLAGALAAAWWGASVLAASPYCP